jgi:hypothetical protein
MQQFIQPTSVFNESEHSGYKKIGALQVDFKTQNGGFLQNGSNDSD